MLFEREPRLVVGPIEHRLADAAPKLIDCEPVANGDAHGDDRDDCRDDRDREDREIFQCAWMAERQGHI